MLKRLPISELHNPVIPVAERGFQSSSRQKEAGNHHGQRNKSSLQRGSLAVFFLPMTVSSRFLPASNSPTSFPRVTLVTLLSAHTFETPLHISLPARAGPSETHVWAVRGGLPPRKSGRSALLRTSKALHRRAAVMFLLTSSGSPCRLRPPRTPSSSSARCGRGTNLHPQPS